MSASLLDQNVFADDLEYEEEIGARLNPLKRQLEDCVEPESKRMAKSTNFLPKTDFHVENAGTTFVRKGNTSVMLIPKSKVGLIIGRHGTTIKQLQERSGAKMYIVQDPLNMSDEKPLHVSGDANQLETVRLLIESILGQKKSYEFEEDENQHDNIKTVTIEVLVPQMAVAMVIGTKGEMIRKLQNETGTTIQIHQAKAPGPHDRLCFISGAQTNVNHANQRLKEIIDSVCSGRGRTGEFTFMVSSSTCGLIIGKGGATIKSIIKFSGVHLELDRSYQGEGRAFIIRGGKTQIEVAQKIISEKIRLPIYLIPVVSKNNPETDYPSAAMGYQNWSGPYQHQLGGATSQVGPDYSMQWANYFRSIIHAQSENGSNGQASTTTIANSAVGTFEQPNYSAQWLEFYLRHGMDKYSR